MNPNEAIQAARRCNGRYVDNIRVAENARKFNEEYGWTIRSASTPYIGRYFQIVDRDGNVKHSPFTKRSDAAAFMLGLMDRCAAGKEVW